MNATPANPLWMPPGSVHAITMFVPLGVSAYMVVEGLEVPQWWQALTIAAMGGYSLYRHRATSGQLSGRTYESQVNLDEVDLMKREGSGNA